MLEEVAFDEEEDLYIALNCLLKNYFLIVREKIVLSQRRKVAETTLSDRSYHQH